MSLITVKRNVPIYATFTSAFNTGAAATTKSILFSNGVISNNGITVVNNYSIRVPDSGNYEFSITLGASNASAFIAKFQYGINGTFTDIVTTISSITSADRFNIVIPLNGNDLVEFRALAISGLVANAFCSFVNEPTRPSDTTTVKRI
jgi:hypothetical protein